VNAIKVDPGLRILQGLHENYDLVSWDPRGIGLARPVASCNISSNSTYSLSEKLSSLDPVRKRSLDKIHGPEGLELNITEDMERRFNLSAQCQAQFSGVNGIGSQYVF